MTWYLWIALAVVVVCVLRGTQVGLIRSACGLLAVLVAMGVASQGAELLSDTVADSIAPPLSTMLESQITDVLTDAFGEAAMDALDSSALLSSADIVSLLKALGLYDTVVETVDSAVSTTLAAVVPPVADSIAEMLAGYIAYTLLYICIFSLVLVIGRLLGGVLNLADRVPGVHLLNRAGGAVFGLLKGAALLLTVWVLLQKLGLMDQTSLLDGQAAGLLDSLPSAA